MWTSAWDSANLYHMKKDIFGRSEAQARKIFGPNHASSTIKLVKGVWLARWLSKATIRRQHDDIMPYAVFAAIDRDGDVVSNGTRRDTLTLAGLCKCGQHPAEPAHRCPYQSDINDNQDPEYCTCCGECQSNCVADV